MQETHFRQWIEAGFRTYGDDPWFFLRELAQNSRDAGARTVRISVAPSDRKQEMLTFLDDGSGMSFAHARKFLFRLYASSKSHDKYSAGMYGIGFWTILRFQPELIVIESRTGDQSWSIEIDSRFRIKTTPCQLNQKGTRITLIRKSRNRNPEKFTEAVKERAIHYCGYLRRNNHQTSPLPVFFEGRCISREFELPLVIGSPFKRGPVEGLVGFDHQPRVILYARGLPVWEGTRLDELFHLPPEKEPESEISPGLAPVFLINGNHLDVNISRKTILESRALEKVKKTAEREMSHLIDGYANRIFHHNWFQKLRLRIKKMGQKWKPRFWLSLFILLLILIPLEIVLLKTLLPSWAGTKSSSRPGANAFLKPEIPSYPGATVLPFSRPQPLNMSYSPKTDIWFKVFTAGTYHPKQGFIRSSNQPTFSLAVNRPCSDKKISVRLQIPGSGSLFLPRPIGHDIQPDSLVINRIPVRGIKLTPGGETIINLSTSDGDIRYHCCPTTGRDEALPASPGQWTRLPVRLKIPAGIQRILETADELNPGQKIQLAIELTTENLLYDTSPETARAYQQDGNDSDWVEKVLSIGKGDCDIINGLTVLWLRKMGVPARLVIGLVGIQGTIQASLHAWTEYELQGWQILDTSRLTARATPLALNQRVQESPRPGTPKTPRLWLYLLLSILICLVPVLFFLLKKNQKSLIPRGQQLDEIKQNLARMAIGALLQPRLWDDHAIFREYRIIPTVNNQAISLERALTLARQGKLLAGGPTNPLSKEFSQQGHPVLDLDDRAFSGLIRLIPGVVDLNLIRDLKVRVLPIPGDPALSGFLEHVNQTLKAIKRSLPPCLVSFGLNHQEVLRVKFPGPPVSAGGILRLIWPRNRNNVSGLPRQFLTINPQSQRIRDLVLLYFKTPSLARFRMIKMVINQAGLLGEQKKKLLRKTSRILLQEDLAP